MPAIRPTARRDRKRDNRRSVDQRTSSAWRQESWLLVTESDADDPEVGVKLRELPLT